MKDSDRNFGQRPEMPEEDDLDDTTEMFIPDKATQDKILNFGGSHGMSLGETADFLETTEEDVWDRTIGKEHFEALWNGTAKPIKPQE